MRAGEDTETATARAAAVLGLELERAGLSTAALRRRAKGQIELEHENGELRTQLADARRALAALGEDRDQLADLVARLCAAQIAEVATGRPRLRLVGLDGAS